MEQVLGYPEASPAVPMSFQGVLEWLAFPGALLLMVGLFVRPVALVLSALSFVMYVVGPLQVGWLTHRNGGDPVLLNAFFFLYLAAAGGGAWSVDRLRNPWEGEEKHAPWGRYAYAMLRIAAGYLFLFHGLEKWFGVGGGTGSIDLTTLRGIAGLLENAGGLLLMLGLFTRPTAFVLSGQMAVAYFTAWAPRGFWRSFDGPGMEASILFCFLYLFISAAGPGAWSMDSLMRERRDTT
jgi:putative oxidoreductase